MSIAGPRAVALRKLFGWRAGSLAEGLRQHFCQLLLPIAGLRMIWSTRWGTPGGPLALFDEWDFGDWTRCYYGGSVHPVFVALAETSRV